MASCPASYIFDLTYIKQYLNYFSHSVSKYFFWGVCGSGGSVWKMQSQAPDTLLPTQIFSSTCKPDSGRYSWLIILQLSNASCLLQNKHHTPHRCLQGSRPGPDLPPALSLSLPSWTFSIPQTSPATASSRLLGCVFPLSGKLLSAVTSTAVIFFLQSTPDIITWL